MEERSVPSEEGSQIQPSVSEPNIPSSENATPPTPAASSQSKSAPAKKRSLIRHVLLMGYKPKKKRSRASTSQTDEEERVRRPPRALRAGLQTTPASPKSKIRTVGKVHATRNEGTASAREIFSNASNSVAAHPPTDQPLPDIMLHKRRERSLKLLQSANDYVTMKAAYGLVQELHGNSKLYPEAKSLVEDASISLPFLLHRMMSTGLAEAKDCDGKLVFTPKEGTEIMDQVFKNFGSGILDKLPSKHRLIDATGLSKPAASTLLHEMESVIKLVADCRSSFSKHV